MFPRVMARANVISLAVLVVGVLLTGLNILTLRRMQSDFFELYRVKESVSEGGGHAPKFTVYGKNIDSGYLAHVYGPLERAGFVRTNYSVDSDWSLLWAHDYPFTKIRSTVMAMKPHQRVNKFPGSGFVTNKVNLATSGLEHVPRAFHIPDEVDDLKAYASANPKKMFVQKNSNHRGIKIETIENLDLGRAKSFVQEFVDDPFLVDGYKFDIGVYTMVTSIDPLRIYVFEGDVLLRFCPEKYYPFDPENKDKYVVHDDYRPTWKVPTLAKLYSDLGYSFKETLNTHIRAEGKDPERMWEQVYDVIRNVYKRKEKSFADALKKYPHKRAFFEMVRFDFVLDAQLNVYLMEANMSPNLSSKHFAPNRLLYEQVVYSLLRLTGVLRGGIAGEDLVPSSREETEMQVADKDLHTFADLCVSEACSSASACEERSCHLCKHCLTQTEIGYLRPAFLEHANRHSARRIFPEPVTREEARKWREYPHPKNETDANVKMRQWFAGKCLIDRNWCD